MKKYITLAALLAAGTACANAADKLTLDMIPNSDWTPITLTTPTNGELTSSNSGFAWENGSNLTESWQLSFMWQSTNEKTTEGNNANNGYFKLFGTNGQNSASGVTVEYSVDDEALKVKSSGQDLISIENVEQPTGSAVNVVLTYLKSNDTTKYDSTFILQIGDASVSSTAPENNTTFLYNGNTRLWTNGGKDTFGNITLKSASAVPEPSAFGMLAGLGALALVASRRRRK